MATSAVAGSSDAADRRASSWFNPTTETLMKRMPGLSKEDTGQCALALKRSIGTVEPEMFLFALPAFNPLWDKTGAPVPGAIRKYSKRMEQLSKKAVEEWQGLTEGSAPSTGVFSALSLAAENDLFPNEQFNEKAFKAFLAKYR
jgi:hypothetical protein